MSTIRRQEALWLVALAAAMVPRPAQAAERSRAPIASQPEAAASASPRVPAEKRVPRRAEPERWDGLDLERLDRQRMERLQRAMRPVFLSEEPGPFR